jgi:NAD(P)-dependent dehydrogenase (short-subunit alcohol dehydrogenase family)
MLPATERALAGRVALVAGATRGAGRAIARELGRAGAAVYATGRSTTAGRSPMNRPETIEQTVAMIADEGGTAVAVRVDHAVVPEVRALVERIDAEQGRLDILVNDIWGGDPLTEWGVPFWQHDLENGLALLHQAVDTHLITSWHAAPLLNRTGDGLIVEVTDGIAARYRGSLFYDLAKSSVVRLALAQAEELRDSGTAVVALTPGFLRSEAVLDHFGVTEANWRDAIAEDAHFAHSETPHYVGRAVAALAADPNILTQTGAALTSWGVARTYQLTDLDGTRPDWGAHAAAAFGWDDG